MARTCISSMIMINNLKISELIFSKFMRTKKQKRLILIAIVLLLLLLTWIELAVGIFGTPFAGS